MKLGALMSKPILLVDDDTQLCELLSDYLSGQGFIPTVVNSGEQALAVLAKNTVFDAMVLDIMMPQMSGLELLQIVRQNKAITTPIIMLTGRGDDVDCIVGLELGADDYMGKPCNPRELAARLRAVIRRCETTSAANNATPKLHGIVLNTATLAATCRGQALNLTGAEFHVLQCLLLGAGQLLSKHYLTQQALHRELTAYDRSIDVHVSRIRHKLAACGLADVIRAVRGQGYQLLMPHSS